MLSKFESHFLNILFLTYNYSRTRFEYNFDCSLFKFMCEKVQGSDQRVFYGSIESDVHFHGICTVESIFGKIFKCDLHIHLDIHGRICDGNERRTGQSI